VRATTRAHELIGLGARRVIVGSALFAGDTINTAWAAELAEAIGIDRLVGAVDSRGGRVVIHGWKTPLAITPTDAMRALEPFVAAYLYTHVDTEGLLTGLDLALLKSI